MNINHPRETFRLKFQVPSSLWPTQVAFLGDRLAAANQQGQILLWDLSDQAKPDTAQKTEQDSPQAGEEAGEGEGVDRPPVLQLVGHDNGVTRLIPLDDGRTLISASLDGTIRFWDLQQTPGDAAPVVLDQKDRQQAARRTKDDEAAAILEAPGLATPTLTPAVTLSEHAAWIRALGVSGDGRRMVSGDDSGKTIVWDLPARRPLVHWQGHPRTWITSAALSPDGSLAFTAEYAGRRSSFDVPAAQARLWDAVSGELQSDLLKVWTPDVKDKDRVDSYGYGQAWGKLIKRGLVAARFSPDGSLLAMSQNGETQQGEILVAKVESGEIVHTLSGHAGGARDVRFSSDGSHLVSSGRDTTLRIWDVAKGEQVAELGKGRGGQFKDWFDGIALDSDDLRVAAADIAGFVRVWSLDGAQ